MDLPIDFEVNYLWVALIFSFLLVPLILIIFKRWWIVIVQTILIAAVSGFVTYTNLYGLALQGNDLYFAVFYGAIFVYFALGLYALIESLYRKFAM